MFWWWWEFRLGTIETWTFQLYMFVVLYAFIMFLACALLFPASMEGYKDYKAYFYSQKAWLFGVIGLSYLLDLVDNLVKGLEYFVSLGMEYWVATLLQLAFCITGMVTANERFHAVFAIGVLSYKISWAVRMYETVA